MPHHLIGFLSPEERFSVADYTTAARQVIGDIHARGKLPILCGGTGLYVNALLDHVRFDDTGSDEKIRARLAAYAQEHGNQALWERLCAVDEPTAQELHPNNLSRVVRALEVYELTGERLSVHKQNSRTEPSPYEPVMIGLTCSDRALLYERIDRRVDEMLQQGLVAEAEAFFATYQAKTARQAIGIKELLPYFMHEVDLADCVEKIKRETRHYAKRQLTWFRRDSRIFWIETDKCGNLKKIIEKIKNIIAKTEII